MLLTVININKQTNNVVGRTRTYITMASNVRASNPSMVVVQDTLCGDLSGKLAVSATQDSAALPDSMSSRWNQASAKTSPPKNYIYINNIIY